MKDNSIDISHLKKVDLTVGDLTDLIAIIDCLSAMFMLPITVTEALERLRKLIERQ